MSGGFFRGTSADQDTRFSNKQAKLMKSQKFPPELEHLVNMTKVKMDVMRPWIAKRVTELIGFEDEVLINFIYGLLEGKEVNGKQVQISLTGFMERNTGKFMKELWALLLSAQNNASGVPQQFLDAKEEETQKKKAEMDRIADEILRKKEKDNREDQEKRKKMDDYGNNAREGNDALEPTLKHQSEVRSSDNLYPIERNGSRRSRNRRSRSISKSLSNSGERRRARSTSGSPEQREGRSISSERLNSSPVRRSVSPRRKHSPRRSLSPLRHRQRSTSRVRRRSPSPARYRRHSPFYRRSRSPVRRRSRSPVRRRSRSPVRRRSRSPIRRRSRSPIRRRSRSPIRRRSRSPIRLRSRSPMWRRSRSPIRRSPMRNRLSSPVRHRSPPSIQRTPSPTQHRSPSPVRRRYRRSPSSPRRGSPSPIRRRSPISDRRRSLTPARRRSMSPVRSRSPQDSMSPSPIHRRSPLPTRKRTPNTERSPVQSPRGRIRSRERHSDVQHSSAAQRIEQPLKARKRSISLERGHPVSSRSPQRDLYDHKGSQRKDLPSPPHHLSPSASESPPATRGRSPGEDRRPRSPYKSTLNGREGKKIDTNSACPGKPREHKARRDISERSADEKEKNDSRGVSEHKPRSSSKMHTTTDQHKDLGRGKHKNEFSEIQSHSDGLESRKQTEVIKSEKISGMVEHAKELDRQKSPGKGERESYGRESFKGDKKNQSHTNDTKGNGLHIESKTSLTSSRKVEQNDQSGTEHSGSEESDKRRKIKEKKKHKRSSRYKSSSDDSSDSDVEDRKEVKRRRKEDKRLKKEEKRRRREERRRQKEERRSHKLKLKSVNAMSTPSDNGCAADVEGVKEEDPRGHGIKESESLQKRLEIELREKALESLRAKKGINH